MDHMPAYRAACRGVVNGQIDRLAVEDFHAHATQRAVADFAALPSLVAEVVISDEEAAEIAMALRLGDLAGVGKVFRVARDRYVADLIEQRRDDQPWLDEFAAAEQLRGIYA